MASLLSGDLMQSAVYYEQAIVLFRKLDERERLPNSLATLMLCGGNYQNLTVIPAAVGFAESLQQGELALKIAGEIGQRSDEAYTLIHMAICLGPRGEYARALEVAQRGLAIAEDIEHRQWMTAGHRALGALYLDLLAFSEAQQHLEQSLALAQEIGSRYWTRIASAFLALVCLAQHDVTRAESLLNAALGLMIPPKRSGRGSSGMLVQNSRLPTMIHFLPCTSPINCSHPPSASRVSRAFLASRNCVGRHSPN